MEDYIMTTLEKTITKTYKQTSVRVVQSYDEFAESPRNWDNLTTIICHHRRYALGDVEVSREFTGYDSLKELKKALVDSYGEMAYIKPLSLYDHSMQTLSIGEPTDRWDSGYVGFIFVTKEQARRWYGVKRVTKTILEKIEKSAQAEVEEYNKICLWGEVYQLKLQNVFTNADDATDTFTATEECIGGFTFSDYYTVETAVKDYFGLEKGQYELVEE